MKKLYITVYNNRFEGYALRYEKMYHFDDVLWQAARRYRDVLCFTAVLFKHQTFDGLTSQPAQWRPEYRKSK